MKYQLQGVTSEEDAAVITIPYVRPETVRVSIGPTKESAILLDPEIGPPGTNMNDMVNLTSPSGTNHWFWTTNKIKFTIKGSEILWLEIVDSIQLTMRLSVTHEEFWASDGPTNFVDRLAAVLNIPRYRIRIVDTYEGSTVIKA